MGDLLDLAREVVTLPGWRWLPGMRLTAGDRLLAHDGAHWHCGGDVAPCAWLRWRHDRMGDADYGSLPDLADPATLGCLLALVREAHGRDSLVTAHIGVMLVDGEPAPEWVVRVSWSGPKFGTGPSEAHALVAALRAAGGA